MLYGIFLVVAAIVGSIFLFKGSASALTVSTGSTKAYSSEDVNLQVLLQALRYSVDIPLVKAFIKVESDWIVYAVNPVSSTNAVVSYGLMQITPALAEDYGLIKDHYNPTDAEIAQLYVPENNIGCGCWQLSRLLESYDQDVAIQMYNVGITGYNKGARNADYLAKIKKAYESYK